MSASFRWDSETALVRTEQGIVQGYTQNGLSIFKGIPYAAARRFHAPESAAPWEGIRDATSYGFVCPLLSADRPNGELYVPHRYWPMDEDCQNLNVWTPGLDGKKRPVLVWLHGGGFEAGSAIEHLAYDGANLSRLGDVVVVSVNHRLNILGYLDLSDYGAEYANSGNAGTDDIIMALRWVRDNIARFGGDPDNVTVFGQSGGGAKVTTLLQTPAADGLYHRGIVMSGVIGPVLADQTGSGKPLAEALLRELHLDDVRELETVPYFLLAQAYQKVKLALHQQGAYVGCCPHPNDFYRGEPVANGFRPETARIPLLVGSTFSEFLGFGPFPYDTSLPDGEQIAILERELGEESTGTVLPLFQAAYPERHPLDLLRLDMVFRGPEIPYIAERSRLNRCTWSYLFNLDQPVLGGTPPWHCADVPYVFHNLDLVEYPHGHGGEPATTDLEAKIFAAVLAFARTGDPNTDSLPPWPACSEDRENTMLLDAHPRVRPDFDHPLQAACPQALGPYLASVMARMAVQH